MGKRVRALGLSLVVSAASLACSGEDAGPPGAGSGVTGGGAAGASGSSGLAVGGRAGQAGTAGVGGSAGASGSGGVAGAGGSAGTAGMAGTAGAGGTVQTTRASTVIAGDDHSCALGSKGEVLCWGYRGDLPAQDTQSILVQPSVIPLPPMQTLVGHRHFCALTQAARALHCWGEDTPGVLAAKPNVFPAAFEVGGPVDDVAIAFRTTCIRQQGNVSCFGLQSLGGTGAAAGAQDKTAVPGIVDAISLVGNGSYFCARRPTFAGGSGGVKATCWGEGLLTPTDVPGETDVADVAITAEGYVLVRRTNGTVGGARAPSGASDKGFGAAFEVPIDPVDAIVADNTLCGIRTADKRVLCASLVDATPAKPQAFKEISDLPAGDPPVEISTNGSHSNFGLDTTCVRTAAGKAFCWGADRWAQMGAGLVGWELEPKLVTGVANAVRVGVSGLVSAASIEGGSALHWGSARAFGHTIENGKPSLSPTPLPGVTDDVIDVQIGPDEERAYGVRKGSAPLYMAEFGASATNEALQKFPGAPVFLPGIAKHRDVDFGVAGTGSGTFLAFFVPDPKNVALGDSGILANGGGAAGMAYLSYPLPNLVGFAHGPFHGLAWDSLGTLHCWGFADEARCGQPPSQTKNVVTPIPMTLPGERIVDACGGWDNTCAVTQTGKVFCWGGLEYGLGGKATDEQQADQKAIAKPMKGIACGAYNACAWSDDEVYCWGDNDTAQLGLGDRVDRTTPTLVPKLPGAKHMALGPEHTCAVTTGKGVACWGSPMGGRLGNEMLGYYPAVARPVALP